MPPLLPAPLHYTLRLKLHKTTILIVADPLLPLSHIKTELLRALTARYHSSDNTITTATGSARIPTIEADILLAKPVDPHDLSKGWRRLKVPGEIEGDRADGFMHDLDEDENANANTNIKTPPSKRPAPKATNITSALPTSPREAGLKDGSVLAFKFRGHAVRKGRGDEGLGMEMDEDEEWDVVLPSYEEGGTFIGDRDGEEEEDGVAAGAGV